MVARGCRKQWWWWNWCALPPEKPWSWSPKILILPFSQKNFNLCFFLMNGGSLLKSVIPSPKKSESPSKEILIFPSIKKFWSSLPLKRFYSTLTRNSDLPHSKKFPLKENLILFNVISSPCLILLSYMVVLLLNPHNGLI